MLFGLCFVLIETWCFIWSLMVLVNQCYISISVHVLSWDKRACTKLGVKEDSSLKDTTLNSLCLVWSCRNRVKTTNWSYPHFHVPRKWPVILLAIWCKRILIRKKRKKKKKDRKNESEAFILIPKLSWERYSRKEARWLS